MTKILFITLSNIGDAILTLPVLDALMERHPKARITILTGERPRGLFENNPLFEKVIVFDKRIKLREKIRLFQNLNRERFDIVVDLRNSFFGVFLSGKNKTSPLRRVPSSIKHMQKRHLYFSGQNVTAAASRALYISAEDQRKIEDILSKHNIDEGSTLIAIAAGARSSIKRWPKERFAELALALSKEFNARVVLVGDKDDAVVARHIQERLNGKGLDLSGKTSFIQLAALLKKVKLLVSNDSAVMHLASYLNIPVVAVFGPTDEEKYGPWSERSKVVKKAIICRSCSKAQCKREILECMQLIKTEDVLIQSRNILAHSQQPVARGLQDFKRILIMRTDRIGDVIISTPVIKALRDSYPSAYIAMVVNPYAREIIEGNPYLDQVIIYDKDGKHKSWQRTLKFALNLRKKRFDLAVILHPTNRSHLIAYFAGIPARVGYDRKLGYLLTDRIKHTKQLGEKHESEYNFSLLEHLGIKAAARELFMPIRNEAEDWARELFKEEGITGQDRLLAIHPGASCPSKIWPQERFAEVADKLAEEHGFKVLVVAGPKDIGIAHNVIKLMKHPVIDLAGKTSLSQLASVLKRCRLFISNDSGPVHIASAIGTPVVAIFGRSQKGLSPKRWGPSGEKDRILHQSVGCIECLAHNCRKEFACLKAVTPEAVIDAAGSILREI